MKLRSLVWLAASAWLIPPTFAQDVTISSQAEPPNAIKTKATAVKLSITQVNVDLATARTANKEKQFTTAEALMLEATASRPEFLFSWVELGQAQLGLKKYDEAETSFKNVLGIGPASQNQAGVSGLRDMNGFGANGAPSLAGGSNGVNPQRTPDVEGIAWSDLGEIDIHASKIKDAQSAFDHAAKMDPKNAALYRNNETVFFFQAGDAVAQVDAANQAIALDTGNASLYYFKAQGLTGQATVDAQTQKLILPPGCANAYRKYLVLSPEGQFANDVKTVLAAAQNSD
jgi:tetratricopeptide (TPR) repeat protein